MPCCCPQKFFSLLGGAGIPACLPHLRDSSLRKASQHLPAWLLARGWWYTFPSLFPGSLTIFHLASWSVVSDQWWVWRLGLHKPDSAFLKEARWGTLRLNPVSDLVHINFIFFFLICKMGYVK